MYRELGRHTLRYVAILLKNIRSLAPMGFDVARLYSNIMQARAYTSEGTNNVFLFCEHHELLKTIRNEFIRKDGSKTVFFPYLPGFALRYYPQEFYPRYDFVLSSGRFLEDHYLESGAVDPVFLPVGCCTIHSNAGGNSAVQERVRMLAEKAGQEVIVTVLCPGVCRPTYYSEMKLMELARHVADESGVRVFIRQKPFVPEPEYRGFYESYTNGHSSMHLTGMEYELFDFMPVTHLFITTYSTSACEVALRGGNIFFVDYMKHPDRFIFWRKEVAEGVLLDGDEAFERIIAWIKDRPDGPVRTAHKAAMERFVDYIGYKFPDYESFRKNLLSQLEEHVFRDWSRRKRA